MIEKSDHELDMKQSMLTSPMIPISDLIKEFAGKVDNETVNSFKDLSVFGKVPENKEPLQQLLKDRIDFVSRACLEKLGG